jgi:hypothetical protein
MIFPVDSPKMIGMKGFQPFDFLVVPHPKFDAVFS